MQYSLNSTSFFIGIAVLIIGVLFVKWYQKIADAFGAGPGAYEKYKIYGLIICGLGILLMVNLPAFLINLTLGSLFNR